MDLGVLLLNWASKNGTAGYPEEAPAYIGRSKLEILLGSHIWEELRGRTVLDFGCGKGAQAVEAAEHGAEKVIGLEIRQTSLRLASQHAAARGVADKCLFAQGYNEPVDVIICIDSFEHFADPAEILRIMSRLLKPNGKVLISFGPTWYHPLGGHKFSVFPWSHLLFPERTLIKWRSLYKRDGAQSISEAGLNRMSIRRFRALVRESRLRCVHFEMVPIRRMKLLHNALTREFTTAIVRGTLVNR
jgi:SAM-dependent methyltransferase